MSVVTHHNKSPHCPFNVQVNPKFTHGRFEGFRDLKALHTHTQLFSFTLCRQKHLKATNVKLSQLHTGDATVRGRQRGITVFIPAPGKDRISQRSEGRVGQPGTGEDTPSNSSRSVTGQRWNNRKKSTNALHRINQINGGFSSSPDNVGSLKYAKESSRKQ